MVQLWVTLPPILERMQRIRGYYALCKSGIDILFTLTDIWAIEPFKFWAFLAIVGTIWG